MSEANVGYKVGQTAPDFTLPDADGNEWSLFAQRGRVVAILFYPGDETPVCTKQLCSVRNRWQDYVETGAVVVGISSDSSASHKSFAANHNLPLPLLADAGAKVAGLYGMRSIIPGQAARGVVVIDGTGVVRYYFLRSLMGLLVAPKDDDTIAAIKAIQRGETPA